MLTIGLTGGVGSGKSTVAAMLSRLGARVLDTDKVVHRILREDRECIRRIGRRWGPAVLDADGTVDRRKLAEAVFGDPSGLRQLERMLHPLVRKECLAAIKECRRAKARALVLEVPLLFESGFDSLVDLTVVVRATAEEEISRTRRRWKIARSEIVRRINRQMRMSEKLLRADVVIDNRGSRARTQRQVRDLWRECVRNGNRKQANKTKGKIRG